MIQQVRAESNCGRARREGRREALRLVHRHPRSRSSRANLFRQPNWRTICDAQQTVSLISTYRQMAGAALAVAFVALTWSACSKTETSITAPTPPTSERCDVTVTSSPATFPPPGGQGALTIATARDCTWSVSTDATWVAIGGQRSGQGEASVAYSVAANPVPSPRSAAFVVGSKSVPVSQQAAPCVFSLSRANDTIGANGGRLSVAVTTLTGCRWTAASSAAWITVADGQSASASGTVGLAVAANTATARVGQVTIAGHAYT